MNQQKPRMFKVCRYFPSRGISGLSYNYLLIILMYLQKTLFLSIFVPTLTRPCVRFKFIKIYTLTSFQVFLLFAGTLDKTQRTIAVFGFIVQFQAAHLSLPMVFMIISLIIGGIGNLMKAQDVTNFWLNLLVV